MTKTPTNHARRIQALLKKTTFNGCTPGEAASALGLASTLVAKHKLSPAEFEWPAAPEGYAWNGTPGAGGEVVAHEPVAEEPVAEERAKPKRVRKPKSEPKPKRPTRKDRVIELLRSKDGTTIQALMTEFGILAHSARALVSIFGREAGGVDYNRETKVYRAKA